jgi:FMN reductase
MTAMANRPPMSIKVVGLGGSMAVPSRSLAALKLGLAAAQEAGATTELLDLRELSLPMYVPTTHDFPTAVYRLLDEVYGAHGLLWSSPLYQGTISGAFKNALDWLHPLEDRQPPFLTDKVVGLMSTAGGVYGVQAVNTMEFSVRALRALAIPLVVPVARAGQAFDAEGRAAEPGTEAMLRRLGQEVVRVARNFQQGAALDEECERAKARLSLAVS